MAESHVVSALLERRARVAGDIVQAQMRVVRLRVDLAAIDACIRMFKADYDPATVTPKTTFSKSPAKLPKGMGTRKALELLRETGEALSADDLARRVLVLLGKELDQDSVRMLATTIHSSFKRQRNPVVRYDRSTWPGKWRLLP